jgi:serine/threonine-protein kinase
MVGKSLSSSASSLRVGATFAGRYVVEAMLGEGGMGVVLLAIHKSLGQRVALKVIQPEFAEHAEIRARFERESRSVAKLRSDHVVRVFDAGVAAESGAPFMVMEFLEGEDVETLVRREGKLSPSRAAEVVLQACDALAEAHEKGIVHRDLKPANLYAVRRPNGELFIKVLDFGISKLRGSATSVAMTSANQILGSPSYMSPEQYRHADAVDERSDIWSLGVILHYLVSGSLPFRGENVAQIAAAVLTEPMPDVSFAGATLGPILRDCLQRDKASRVPSVLELASRLARLVDPGVMRRLPHLAPSRGGQQRADVDAPSPQLAAPPSPGLATDSAWQHATLGAPATTSSKRAVGGAVVIVVVFLLSLGTTIGVLRSTGLGDAHATSVRAGNDVRDADPTRRSARPSKPVAPMSSESLAGHATPAPTVANSATRASVSRAHHPAAQTTATATASDGRTPNDSLPGRF